MAYANGRFNLARYQRRFFFVPCVILHEDANSRGRSFILLLFFFSIAAVLPQNQDGVSKKVSWKRLFSFISEQRECPKILIYLVSKVSKKTS